MGTCTVLRSLGGRDLSENQDSCGLEHSLLQVVQVGVGPNNAVLEVSKAPVEGMENAQEMTITDAMV